MNNRKFVIGVILLLILMLGGTYAYYKWTSSNNMDFEVEIKGGTVIFEGGKDINGELIPTSKKEEGIIKDITVKGNTEGATINLYMDLTTMSDNLKEESFKYEVYYNDNVLVSSGNFGVYNSSSNPNGINYNANGITKLTLFTGRDISINSTDKYTLYLWFNGKDYDNPDTMQNNNILFELYATGENAILSE